MCMKKSILLALICAFVFVGCESGDAIDYSNYPIAGKSYKTEGGSDFYNIYTFTKDGTCKSEHYINDKYVSTISDYWWWMEGDSIFINVSPKRDFKYKRGCYHTTYIILDHRKGTLVN